MEKLYEEDCPRDEVTQVASSSGVAEYCVVCQAPHAMAPSCLTCRACGAPGHLARDCRVDRVDGAEPSTMDEAATVKEVIVADDEDETMSDAVMQEKAPEQTDGARKRKRENKREKRERVREDSLVFCHMEVLRSSLSPTLHLTQLAATTHTSTFFRPILPQILTHYLDNFKIGGEVLGALNMVREGATSFLFRPAVLVEQVERVECVREEEALVAFLDMLEGLGRSVVLVGVDEDTVGLLIARLKAVDKARVRGLVAGYTWWRRVLKHTSYPGYSTLELEEFHQEAFPTSTPAPLATSPVVASILREAVIKVAVRQGLAMSRLVAQVAIDIRYKAKVVEKQVESGREALEVVNSYRPDVPLSFAVDRMDQVDLDSGSENEVQELKEIVVISDDDGEEVNSKVISWRSYDEIVEGKVVKRLICPVARCSCLINPEKMLIHLHEAHINNWSPLVVRGCDTCGIQPNSLVTLNQLVQHVSCQMNRREDGLKDQEWVMRISRKGSTFVKCPYCNFEENIRRKSFASHMELKHSDKTGVALSCRWKAEEAPCCSTKVLFTEVVAHTEGHRGAELPSPVPSSLHKHPPQPLPRAQGRGWGARAPHI